MNNTIQKERSFGITLAFYYYDNTVFDACCHTVHYSRVKIT